MTAGSAAVFCVRLIAALLALLVPYIGLSQIGADRTSWLLSYQAVALIGAGLLRLGLHQAAILTTQHSATQEAASFSLRRQQGFLLWGVVLSLVAFPMSLVSIPLLASVGVEFGEGIAAVLPFTISLTVLSSVLCGLLRANKIIALPEAIEFVFPQVAAICFLFLGSDGDSPDWVFGLIWNSGLVGCIAVGVLSWKRSAPLSSDSPASERPVMRWGDLRLGLAFLVPNIANLIMQWGSPLILSVCGMTGYVVGFVIVQKLALTATFFSAALNNFFLVTSATTSSKSSMSPHWLFFLGIAPIAAIILWQILAGRVSSGMIPALIPTGFGTSFAVLSMGYLISASTAVAQANLSMRGSARFVALVHLLMIAILSVAVLTMKQSMTIEALAFVFLSVQAMKLLFFIPSGYRLGSDYSPSLPPK